MGQEQFGQGNVQAAAREMGRWTNVPFLASNFYGAGGLTVTVVPANVIVNRYCKVGNIVFWNLWLNGITLGGVTTNTMFITPPTPNMVAGYHGFQFASISDGDPNTIGGANFNPQQPPNFPASVGLFFIPFRNYTLGSNIQIKMYVSYEFGKSRLMP